jgi:hypothetical protein
VICLLLQRPRAVVIIGWRKYLWPSPMVDDFYLIAFDLYGAGPLQRSF